MQKLLIFDYKNRFYQIKVAIKLYLPFVCAKGCCSIIPSGIMRFEHINQGLLLVNSKNKPNQNADYLTFAFTHECNLPIYEEA